MEDGFVAAVGLLACCFVLWGIVSGWLSARGVSAPIAFVVFGLVVTHGPTAVIDISLHSSVIRLVTELTLALVLFADASRVNASALRRGSGLPIRLLVIGLPLTMLLGAAAAAVLLPEAGVWVAALIATIVAPTDAALVAAVLADDRVPSTLRQALNVESGLNDGIVTPFVNFFLAGAVSADIVRTPHLGAAAIDLVGGVGVGVVVGAGGGLLLRGARRRGLTLGEAVPLVALGLALGSYSGAVVLGVNGFVAAFVAGMAAGTVMATDPNWRDFTEDMGRALSLTVWFIFGAVMLAPGVQGVTWQQAVFALLALTVVRMGPVAVAMGGSGHSAPSVAFVGWFGPRGLASIVFGLLAVDDLPGAQSSAVLGAVTLTIAFSVVLHGVTAGPATRRLARSAGRRSPFR